MNNLVSVIVPAYNHEKYIQEAIQSVIDQTYHDIELIVIDDGSSDATWEKIIQLKDACEKRFTRVVFKMQENCGIIDTLNKLLQLAQGEYIALLASDDKFTPNALQDLHAFLAHNPEYALAVGENLIMDEKSTPCFWASKRKNVYDVHKSKYISNTQYLQMHTKEVDFYSESFGSYQSLLDGNYVPNGYLIRRSIFDTIGSFTRLAPLEDYWLMLQIAKHAKMKCIKSETFYYRWHSNNTVHNKEKMDKITWQTFLFEKIILDNLKNSELQNIYFEQAFKKFYSLALNKNRALFERITNKFRKILNKW